MTHAGPSAAQDVRNPALADARDSVQSIKRSRKSILHSRRAWREVWGSTMAHVMVLDDEPGICWAFRSFLEGDGHRVSVASTAEHGLERASSDPPDVLFLDVRLPGMDGLDALERFRMVCPRTSVVVMTAHGTMQTAVRAVRGGAFDYLSKPFDLDQARGLVARRSKPRGRRRSKAPRPSRRAR